MLVTVAILGTNGDDGGVRIDGGDDDRGHDGCGGLNRYVFECLVHRKWHSLEV